MELKRISEKGCLTLLDEVLAYSNHKSAAKHSAFLLPILHKEVGKGRHLLLPID